MLVLALDTTNRGGSAALARDGGLLGDPALTHALRLPGDIVRLLERHRLTVGDIELFAVAAGPGSFTGLRIGIAAMQGLALANGRGMVGVSALDALNAALQAALPAAATARVGVWMDAQRGDVYSALYRGDEVLDASAVDRP